MPAALHPLQGQSAVVWIRRTFRSRKALSGVTQWFIDWGVPIALIIGVVWVVGAGRSEKGWSGIYRVFTLVDPPAHAVAWGASVLGWLLVPALIGGVAGHVIAARCSGSRTSLPITSPTEKPQTPLQAAGKDHFPGVAPCEER
ncbi:DUF6313 family protein [Streptomyces sp. NPDC003514]